MAIGAVPGCAGRRNAASELQKEPVYAPEGQTKCKVSASQAKPLIVEWPSADRGELEARAQDGVVIVGYEGCEMRLLPHCVAPVNYRYQSITLKRDRLRITNDDELWATIPMGAARFEGKLAAAGELNVEMTIVGRYRAERPLIRASELDGACEGASHALVGMTVGAFEFYAGSAAEIGAGVEVAGAGAGAKSRAQRETLTQDGNSSACEGGGRTPSPPAGCGALLRLEVLALQEGGVAGPATAAVDTRSKARREPVVQPAPSPRTPAAVTPPVTVPPKSPSSEEDASPDARRLPVSDLVTVTADAIRLNQLVLFETGKASIKPKSFALLDAVADVLRARPGLRITVGAHTDSAGDRKYNERLTQRRAESVRQYLIDHGIADSRVTAKGHGSASPIASNESREGRAKNRRIEILIQP